MLNGTTARLRDRFRELASSAMRLPRGIDQTPNLQYSIGMIQFNGRHSRNSFTPKPVLRVIDMCTYIILEINLI